MEIVGGVAVFSSQANLSLSLCVCLSFSLSPPSISSRTEHFLRVYMYHVLMYLAMCPLVHGDRGGVAIFYRARVSLSLSLLLLLPVQHG